MIGYCSNSPLRCSNARSMVKLNQANGSCPDCGMMLVASQRSSAASRLEQRILQISLAITVGLLLTLIVIYYLNFA